MSRTRLSDARRVALGVVSERRRRDGRMRELLRGSDAMRGLDVRDRALATRLAFGTVSAEGMLDQLIDARVRRASALEPRVRDALRLAAFEVLYLETPMPVAVSQGVELVRRASPRAAGLANAVLRQLAEQERPRVEEARGHCLDKDATPDELALASGLPIWLLGRVAKARGVAAACELALCQLEPAPVFVAANLVRHDLDETSQLLFELGLEPVDVASSAGFLLGAPAGLAASGLVERADVVVSDLAAQLVASLAAPMPGERVLEVGQGRGTKSILLQNEALLAGGFARVDGIDSEAYKVRVSSRRMEAAGLGSQVFCHELDGCSLAEACRADWLCEAYDLVFVDAPCSGTGTMRRHPEIAWSLGEKALAGEGSLAKLQLRLLSAAASRVARGGRLVYATCSVLPEENEQIVASFLSSGAGRGFSEEGEAFQTLPERGGFDGHFCAVMRRAEGM